MTPTDVARMAAKSSRRISRIVNPQIWNPRSYHYRRAVGVTREELHDKVCEHFAEFLEEEDHLWGLTTHLFYHDTRGERREIDLKGYHFEIPVGLEVKTGKKGRLNEQRDAFYSSTQWPCYFFHADYERRRKVITLKYKPPRPLKHNVGPEDTELVLPKTVNVPDDKVQPLEDLLHELRRRRDAA